MQKHILDDNFITRLERLTFHMLQPMRGFFGGNHVTKSHGQTVEFADFREYVLGDDIRHIDWNLYSRFEKHFIKLFVDERQMSTQIFLDGSLSIHKADKDKSALMLKMAAAIGYLGVHTMDKISFYAMYENESVNLSGLITSKDAFYRSLSTLESMPFKGDVDIEKAIINTPNLGSNDGLTIIISDFMTDSNWKKAVDFLLYKKRQVLLIQILSPEDINPHFSGRMRLLDTEAVDVLDNRNMRIRITKGHIIAYQEALKDFKEDIKTFSTKRGIHFISLVSDEEAERVIFNQLLRIGMVK